MKRYPKDDTNIDWQNFKWTRFKIVVPTKADEKELRDAFRHFHDARDIDTDYVTVNQLAHQYLDDPGCHIIVDKTTYESLNKTNKV
jgi:hypothetical protein